MRVLFSMRHLGSFRMYESVLRRLVDAGHEVHVVASHRESLGDGGVPDVLLPDVPGIRWSWDEVRPNAWLELATAVRCREARGADPRRALDVAQNERRTG